jgi:crotonobetainyl-CoA:carnitine CoA-transferase CaiB-like acyl-CoA transferase
VILRGIRVLEVASWTFVPSAGAVLADWGADVVKVEPPGSGDPQRGLISSGLVPGVVGGANYLVEQPNRGKRSIALDLKSAEGRAVLDRLIDAADVFLTNYLPDARAKLRIDVGDVRARNPRIVYARGSGQGTRGADAGKTGFDGTSYFARAGIAHALTPPESSRVADQPPAFGDLMGGLALAGGIAAALLARERGGDTPVVDVSLLGLGVWNLAFAIVAAKLYEKVDVPKHGPDDLPNPVARVYYETKDHRHLTFVLLDSDRYWADFCRHVERPDLIDDPRFSSAAARTENRRACIAELRATFARRTYAEWRMRLATLAGAWAPVQTALEVHEDPQVRANGLLPEVTTAEGVSLALAASPIQFDEAAPSLVAAPTHGQHTEEILLELGMSWEDVARLKDTGAIGG